MELTLLGTGAPLGLPRPGCSCAACAAARDADARAATSLLVDGALLLDLTPGAALAAARAGRSLSGVRQVLLTHPSDGPPVEVPAGLPDAGRVPDGRELTLISGHKVRAVPMDAPGTGYEIVSLEGGRLLYLPRGGAPAGDGAAAAPVRHGRRRRGGRPDGLARLRALGAVGPDTDVVAVHLDHDVPPGAGAGAAARGGRGTGRAGRDDAGGEARPGSCRGCRGARWSPAAPGREVAGGRAAPRVLPRRRVRGDERHRDGDAEWADRVSAHRDRRPGSWRTEETCELAPLLREDGPPLLVDCLSLWLTDAMDRVGAWDDDTWAREGRKALRERVAELVAAVRTTSRTVVAVTNEVGAGVVPATAAGRRFRDELGRLNAAFADECEQVLLVVSGQALVLRG